MGASLYKENNKTDADLLFFFYNFSRLWHNYETLITSRAFQHKQNCVRPHTDSSQEVLFVRTSSSLYSKFVSGASYIIYPQSFDSDKSEWNQHKKKHFFYFVPPEQKSNKRKKKNMWQTEAVVETKRANGDVWPCPAAAAK